MMISEMSLGDLRFRVIVNANTRWKHKLYTTESNYEVRARGGLRSRKYPKRLPVHIWAIKLKGCVIRQEIMHAHKREVKTYMISSREIHNTGLGSGTAPNSLVLASEIPAGPLSTSADSATSAEHVSMKTLSRGQLVGIPLPAWRKSDIGIRGAVLQCRSLSVFIYIIYRYVHPTLFCIIRSKVLV